jgi:hypothetical protein
MTLVNNSTVCTLTSLTRPLGAHDAFLRECLVYVVQRVEYYSLASAKWMLNCVLPEVSNSTKCLPGPDSLLGYGGAIVVVGAKVLLDLCSAYVCRSAGDGKSGRFAKRYRSCDVAVYSDCFQDHVTIVEQTKCWYFG